MQLLNCANYDIVCVKCTLCTLLINFKMHLRSSCSIFMVLVWYFLNLKLQCQVNYWRNITVRKKVLLNLLYKSLELFHYLYAAQLKVKDLSVIRDALNFWSIKTWSCSMCLYIILLQNPCSYTNIEQWLHASIAI